METGNELDRIHRPVMPWGMIALVAALSIIGFVIQMTMQGKVETAGGYGWMSISRKSVFYDHRAGGHDGGLFCGLYPHRKTCQVSDDPV